MKVVLREHVEHLGERGQVVSVAAGYARNYLLPKHLAMPATPGNMKVIEHQRRVWEVKEAKEVADAQAIADRLAEIELSVEKKAGNTRINPIRTKAATAVTSPITLILTIRPPHPQRRETRRDAVVNVP